MNKIIPIFFTIDDNYAKYAACAINSIIKNSSKKYTYHIIIVSEGLNEKNKTKLKSFENENFKIMFREIDEASLVIEDREENKLRCDYFTLTIYLRLFLADIFNEYDKAIYIDSDVVVPTDISKLYEIDLKDNIIGACTDYSIQDIDALTYYVENAVGVKRLDYINSGVLLMNLKKMREVGLKNKFLTLLDKYHFDSIAPDQDYINAICNGCILYLDKRWDTMPNPEQALEENPLLIHYNLFQKPWCYDNIQYEGYFWKYALDSGYYEELLEFKKNYSDDKKECDSKSLEKLVSKGLSIPSNEYTFKKVHEELNNIRLGD